MMSASNGGKQQRNRNGKEWLSDDTQSMMNEFSRKKNLFNIWIINAIQTIPFLYTLSSYIRPVSDSGC